MTTTTPPRRPPVRRVGTDAAEVDGEVLDVDPRFRRRRAQVRKQAGRRRFRRLAAVGAVLGVVAAMAALTYSPVLDVDDIAVGGAAQVTDDEVRAASGIDLGAPISYVDLGAATRQIEAMPWVDTAAVGRSFPGSITIEIVERDAFALVSQNGVDLLVDRTGRVLGSVDDRSTADGLVSVVLDGERDPLVAGDTVDAGLGSAIDLAGRLGDNPAGAVASVVLSPDLHLELVEGGTVLFGDGSDLDNKIEDFRTLYARVDRTCLDTIDVRVPGRSVLTRSEPCS